MQWQCTTQHWKVQKELTQLVVFCARVKHSPGPSFDLTLSRFFAALFSSTLSLFMRRPIVVHYIAWDLSEAFDDRQGKVIKESEINWMLNGNRYDDDNDDCVCRTSWAAWHFFLSFLTNNLKTLDMESLGARSHAIDLNSLTFNGMRKYFSRIIKNIPSEHIFCSITADFFSVWRFSFHRLTQNKKWKC